MAETAFAGPWVGSTRRRESASGDAVAGRLWRVGPIDEWEHARCEQRWASGGGSVARLGGCARRDVSLRVASRQWAARFDAWRTWRRPSVSARERAPRKLVLVVLAPAVNLRLDDNAALVAGLQHAALGDADLVVAARDPSLGPTRRRMEIWTRRCDGAARRCVGWMYAVRRGIAAGSSRSTPGVVPVDACRHGTT
eukprot:ctg_1892.g711